MNCYKVETVYLVNVFDVLFQVDKLSAEIHDRKKKDKDRVNSETQTEEYVWTETGLSLFYACLIH